MKKIYTIIAAAIVALGASAAEVTDVISSTTMAIPEVYTELEATFNSDAVYLVTLKDDGNGPQFKAGSSGIVSKVSGGKLKRVEVSWGSKSNEDIVILGQNTPYGASNTLIEGTQLGIIPFTAGTTASLEIEGDWEYIGITTTTNKGKAAQFGSISITWETGDPVVAEPCDGVKINEVCGDDGTLNGNEDWIEFYNPTSATLDLSGVIVQKTDEDGVSEALCTIADGVTLAPGAYYVVEKGTDFTAGLSNNKNLTITLYSPLNKRLDMFDKVSALTHNGSHPAGGSYSLDAATGKWVSTSVATKGAENICYVEIAAVYRTFSPVSALTDGMEVILVNTEYGYVMGYTWDKTKDGGVYLNGAAYDLATVADGKITVDVANTPVARVQLTDGGDGTWALKFIDTNNYLNDSRYMACTAFKNIDFKKKDDPAKGTRATITFNVGGDAEIDFGAGGAIKFNYKGEGDTRFFNYDPLDKPEEHLAVYIYTMDSETGIDGIASDSQGAPVYYNLQGVKVNCPSAGIYIRVNGNRTEKVILK